MSSDQRTFWEKLGLGSEPIENQRHLYINGTSRNKKYRYKNNYVEVTPCPFCLSCRWLLTTRISFGFLLIPFTNIFRKSWIMVSVQNLQLECIIWGACRLLTLATPCVLCPTDYEVQSSHLFPEGTLRTVLALGEHLLPARSYLVYHRALPGGPLDDGLTADVGLGHLADQGGN